MKIIDFGLSDFIRPGISPQKNYALPKNLCFILCFFYSIMNLSWHGENTVFWNQIVKILKCFDDTHIYDWSMPSFTDERLNDIVGSAYYVAPEVLHRSYSTEADMWSIGVITYILLCGSRPFWARTESGIFRSVLRADPNFDDAPWSSISPEAKDFVKRLLNKDYRKRMTAAQALCE